MVGIRLNPVTEIWTVAVQQGDVITGYQVDTPEEIIAIVVELLGGGDGQASGT